MVRMLKTGMARRCVALAGLVALTLCAAVAQAQQAPDQLVKDVASEVLRSLREDPELRAGNVNKMAELIEKKVAPHFDFDRMTRLAVGRNWREATEEQKKLLIAQFRQLLVRSYSTAYTAYRNIVVEVKPARLQPGEDDVQVKSEIKLPGGAPPVNVDYAMYKGESEWKVYDVIVDGVSLVTTYRSTFSEEIRQNGIDGLIKSLREKNTLPPPPPPGKKVQ
jgi:ABC-type transport system involved in resistance to organic solvents, auxiliary component